MDKHASNAPGAYAIRDVIYAEHYARRIAMAVHEQILHFAKDVTHQLLSAYPTGSQNYFVVVEALQKAGLGLLHEGASKATCEQPEAASVTPPAVLEQDEKGASCCSAAVGHPEFSRAPSPTQPVESPLVIKGPWARS